MDIQLECIPCTINSYLRLVKTGIVPESRQEEILRRILGLMADMEYHQSPPVIGRKMHAMIREILQNPDPYRQIKEKYNHMMMDLYPEFKELIDRSAEPVYAAMRLAVAGNVIDFGSQNQLDIMDTINRVMEADLAVDDSRQLFKDLKNAGSLLYIGDNCGEIVLDKLFLSRLNVPEKYFAVRGRPIINDATIEDANLIGMEEAARVITTGDDAPGVIWPSSSKAFKEIFNRADVIISKGQGNLEGLMDNRHPRIYFLLVTKCKFIASRVGTEIGEFIIKKGAKNENYHPL